MGQFILYIGPSGPYYYFENKILKEFHDSAHKYIYILPINRAVRYLKKHCISNSPSGAMMDPPVFTFHTLIRHFYKFTNRKKKIVSDTTRLILLKEALKIYQDEFIFFSDQRLTDKGLIRKIDQMLIEFCQFGYHPSDFDSPPHASEDVYFDFGRILSQLYQIYADELLDETSLVLEVIKDLDQEWFHRIFPHTTTILLNGYGIFTPPMIDFIKKIKQYSLI